VIGRRRGGVFLRALRRRVRFTAFVAHVAGDSLTVFTRLAAREGLESLLAGRIVAGARDT